MSLCKFDLPSLSHVCYNGDFFSIHTDFDHFYWVVSNRFRSTYYGPFSSLIDASNICSDANKRMRWIKDKGDLYYEK